MGIALAGMSVRFNDLTDKLLAAIYLGSDQEVTTSFGTTRAAQVRVVDLDAKINRGTTLVFQQVIADEIRSQAGTWVVGKLVQKPHPKYENGTMYSFETEGVDLEAATEALKEAGIDPEASV